jgi:hypothetical protein
MSRSIYANEYRKEWDVEESCPAIWDDEQHYATMQMVIDNPSCITMQSVVFEEDLTPSLPATSTAVKAAPALHRNQLSLKMLQLISSPAFTRHHGSTPFLKQHKASHASMALDSRPKPSAGTATAGKPSAGKATAGKATATIETTTTAGKATAPTNATNATGNATAPKHATAAAKLVNSAKRPVRLGRRC